MNILHAGNLPLHRYSRTKSYIIFLTAFDGLGVKEENMMKKHKMLMVMIAGYTVWRYIRYQKVELEIARFDYMMRVMKDGQEDIE